MPDHIAQMNIGKDTIINASANSGIGSGEGGATNVPAMTAAATAAASAKNPIRTTRPKITGRKGVVAAGHYLAAAAGMKILAKGGNAVDAGVAAGFALTVVKPAENSMGGEVPILIYSPVEKKAYAISGQGVAPKKATAQWFREQGISVIPADGYLGATVPGLFGSYCTALKKFGRLSLKDVLEPAIDLAEEGYPVYERMAATIAGCAKRYREEWPSSAEVFLPGGKPPEVDQIIKQPALAETFKRLVRAEQSYIDSNPDACSAVTGSDASSTAAGSDVCSAVAGSGTRFAATGPDICSAAADPNACAAAAGREKAIDCAISYYYNEIADDILEFTKNFPVRDSSGKSYTPLLEKEDFTAYRTLVEEPVSARYRDCEIFKCGPWDQGPVLLQQLRLLEGFPLDEMGHNSAEHIHTIIECTKLAFADREKYYGDPLFVDVPLDYLLSEDYNRERRLLVNPDKANNGVMWPPEEVKGGGAYAGDTTHLDSIDCEGFMMSAMPSGGWIPTSPVIPRLGFPLGTRGQMFSLTPGHPNCVEPGKRPRTTLTPGLAFRGGKPWMAFGSPGGDCQDQWSLQLLVNIVDFGMDLQEAIDTPSFHTNHFINSFYPKNVVVGKIFIEEHVGMETLFGLQAKGHILNILEQNSSSSLCAVAINQKTGAVEGAASAKSDGVSYAMGW
jgi:gamma-glutamyltranspeptidase/glutathione hydrolase